MRVSPGPTTRKRHKKILKLSKGYRMTKGKLFKVSNEAVLHAGEYAFMGRRLKKRDFRKLWIIRLNGALKKYNINYSNFIYILKKHNIDLDRKILSKIASEKPSVFDSIVTQVTKK